MMDFDTRFFFYFGSLLMIWLMADNTVASVNLFQQNYPASADVEMSSLKNSVHSLNASHFFSKSDRTTDDKYDMARPLNSKVLNLFRQFFGGQKLSLNFQRNNIGIVSDIFQNPFTFFITDAVFYSLTCVYPVSFHLLLR